MWLSPRLPLLHLCKGIYQRCPHQAAEEQKDMCPLQGAEVESTLVVTRGCRGWEGVCLMCIELQLHKMSNFQRSAVHHSVCS